MVEEYAKDVIMKERKRWLLFGIPWTFTKYTLTPKVQLQLNQRTHLTLFLKLKILKMQEHSEIVLQRPLKMKGSE